MEFLSQQNNRIAGKEIDSKAAINAKNQNVIVIGGGDTGSDCVGTANRQGANSRPVCLQFLHNLNLYHHLQLQ